MKLGLGLRNQAMNAADAVRAILAGTSGVAWDSTDKSTLFTDSAGTTPVTAFTDQGGRQNTFWGSAVQNFQQTTGADRPVYSANGLDYDGTSDHFLSFSNASILANAPGLFYCERFSVASLAASRTLIGFSTNVSTTVRFSLFAAVGGAITVNIRRLDADAVNSFSSSAGLVSINTPYVVSADVDFAGTGLARVWLNGSLIISQALAGVAGNTSNTASASIRKGRSVSAAVYHQGWARRGLMAPASMSAENRQLIETWVGSV